MTPYEIKFSYDFPKNPKDGSFNRNQTVCMSFNGNLDVLGAARWEQNDCITIINDKVKPGQTGSLNCICSVMSNHYIGLITDKSRNIEVILPHTYNLEIRILWILVPLLMLGLCCPCLMMRWDKNDLKTLEEDPYEAKGMTDDFIERF